MNARPVTATILAAVVLSLPACSSAPATPKLKFDGGKVGGCHDILVYKGSADNREFLVVWTDKTKIKLPEKGTETFDLAKPPAGLEVSIDLWETPSKYGPYCTDISEGERKKTTWKATAGKVTITTHGLDVVPEGRSRTYKVTVKLDSVVFDDGAGHKVTLESETIADVGVGWVPG
jgi:hypothetical protein